MQIWIYPGQGLSLSMSATKKDGKPSVSSFTVERPGTLKTREPQR